MASKSTTVELVLRARDEARMTFEQVGKLTQNLSKLQGDLSKSLLGSGKAAQQLETELGRVGNANKSIDSLAKSIDKLGSGREGLEKLKAEASDTGAKLAQLKEAISEATSAGVDPKIQSDFAALAGAASKLQSEIGATTEKLADLRRAANDKALAGNKAALDQAVEAQKRATTAYEKQREALTALIAKERERIGGAAAKTDNNVQRLTQQYEEQIAKVERLAQAKGRDGEMTATQTKQLAAGIRQLEQYGQRLVEAQGKASQAAQAQEAFNSSIMNSAKVREATEKLRDLSLGVREASEDVQALATNLNEVDIGTGTQAKIQALEASLRELEQEYAVVTREAEKARAALEKTTGPIPKDLQQDLSRLEGSLKKTEGAIKGQQAAINGLEQELTEAGVDTRDLAAAQQRLAGAAGQLKTAQQGLASETRRAGEAQRLFANDSRTALNVTQRLRGQVLSLISAYVGFYGIAQQVGKVFGAESEEQTIGLRFSSAFAGDSEKVAKAMSFLRGEAERLKVSFLGSGEEFSKFVSALPPGRYELEEIMKVFTGFTEAGVALGLSNERMKLVFLAITQMAGKGTVQMEELKRQLGESLPPALNLFAEAAGYSADELGEFYKLVESGGLKADILFKVADLMSERYGQQIPEALKKPAAALRALQLQIELLQLEVAKSGFVDTLVEELGKLTALLQEPETREGLKDFAAAIGQVIRALVALAPHVKELIYLFVGIQGLKVASWVSSLGLGMKALSGSGGALVGNLGKLAKGLVALIANATPVARALLLAAAALGFMTQTGADLDKALDSVKDRLEEVKEGIAEIGVLPDNLGDMNESRLKKEIEARTKALEELEEKIKVINEELHPQSGPPMILRRSDLEAVREGLEAAREKALQFKDEIVALEGQLAETGKFKAQPLFFGTLKATEETIKGVAEAMLALENLDVGSNIQRIQSAFELLKHELEDAGRGSAALAQLERERAEAMVAIEKHRSDRTIQILAAEAIEKLRLLDQEGKAGEELAMEQRKIASEMADHRIREAERAFGVLSDQLEAAKQKERGYADEVKRLNQSIGDELERQAEVRSEMGGASSLVAYQRYTEQRQRLAKLTADTERALEQGNYQLAEELARKREALAQKMAETEIVGEKTGAKIVSNEQARAEAARHILDSHSAINQAMAGQRKEAEEAAAVQRDLAESLAANLQELNSTLANLQQEKLDLNAEVNAEELQEQIARIRTEAWANPLVTKLELDDEAALIKLAELQKPTESIHTVRMVLDASGIPMGVMGFAGGGAVPGFASGGKISGPGSKTSDSILARLSRGEWVHQAQAVDFWGESFMDAVNRKDYSAVIRAMGVVARSTGGPISGGYQPAPVETRGGGEVVTLDLSIGGREVGELNGERGVVDALINELRKLK